MTKVEITQIALGQSDMKLHKKNLLCNIIIYCSALMVSSMKYAQKFNQIASLLETFDHTEASSEKAKEQLDDPCNTTLRVGGDEGTADGFLFNIESESGL